MASHFFCGEFALFKKYPFQLSLHWFNCPQPTNTKFLEAALSFFPLDQLTKVSSLGAVIDSINASQSCSGQRMWRSTSSMLMDQQTEEEKASHFSTSLCFLRKLHAHGWGQHAAMDTCESNAYFFFPNKYNI